MGEHVEYEKWEARKLVFISLHVPNADSHQVITVTDHLNNSLTTCQLTVVPTVLGCGTSM